MEYIRAHRKRIGAYVQGFCRKKHEHFTSHDRNKDKTNMKEAETVKDAMFRAKEGEEEPKEEEITEYR